MKEKDLRRWIKEIKARNRKSIKTTSDLKDLLYLVGLIINEKEYDYHDGFVRFMEMVKKLQV